MNDFDSKNYNQDNSTKWVNPKLQNKKIKFILFLTSLPVAIALVIFLKQLKWNDLKFLEKMFLLLETLVLFASVLYIIYIKIKIKLKNQKECLSKIDFTYYK